MKKLNIQITNTTLVLSGLTIILSIAKAIFLRHWYLQSPLSNYDDFLHWSKGYQLRIAAFGIVISILPVFWAWQNYRIYRKAWLYIAAVAIIFFNLQTLLAMAVFLLYVFMLWQEFQEQRKGPV